jgi:hypothetical protein
MTIRVYQAGETVLCEMVFRNDAGELADPASVTFKATLADGSEVSYSSPGDSEISHPACGTYRVNLAPGPVYAGRNTVYFQFQGSGNGIEIVERHQFKGEASAWSYTRGLGLRFRMAKQTWRAPSALVGGAQRFVCNKASYRKPLARADSSLTVRFQIS